MMKRLLGVCASLVLMGCVAHAEPITAEQTAQLQENLRSFSAAEQFVLQANFQSGNATVDAELVATLNEGAASVDMNAVLLDGIKVLAAGIDPVHAAQAYLALTKQIVGSVCLSLPNLFESDSTDQNYNAMFFRKDIGTIMAKIMQHVFEAMGDKQLEISMMFYAMGKDASKAVQQAMQQYMQTEVNQVPQRLYTLDEKYASEKETVIAEDVEAEAVRIMQDYLNGLVLALADCLEQYFPIDRKALGL